MHRSRRFALAIFTFVFFGLIPEGRAQQTIGLFLNAPGAANGYTLIPAQGYAETYLINNAGLLVHSWPHTKLGSSAYLLPNGVLVRSAFRANTWGAAGQQGAVEAYDWDGNLFWEYEYNDSLVRHHHDHEVLPNGNVLILAWERKFTTEAIANGKDPALIPGGEMWPEHIIEVQPVGASGGNIVWEWHVWDHLIQDFDSTQANFGVVADHPELMDINYGTANPDWQHANSVAYNPALDQIVISLNSLSEFWIIDHSTTTAEAASHTGGARGMGGDILYRWGNPENYGRGTAVDRQLYREHNVQWIPPGNVGAGNILLFNNGNGRPGGNYSSIEEVQTSVDVNGDYPVPLPGVPHGPSAATWVYAATPTDSLYGAFASGCQRLPNGNTLMIETPKGTIREVDSSNQEVWKYIFPVNSSGPMTQGQAPTGNLAFRVLRYPSSYSAFDGRDLTPGDPIELQPVTGVPITMETGPLALRANYPNPFRATTSVGWSLARSADVLLTIHDVAGRRVATLLDGHVEAGPHSRSWNAAGLPAGVYNVVLRSGEFAESRKMVVLR